MTKEIYIESAKEMVKQGSCGTIQCKNCPFKGTHGPCATLGDEDENTFWNPATNSKKYLETGIVKECVILEVFYND